MQELAERGLCTATAYRVKELLRRVRQTDTAVKARWQLEIFCKYVRQITEDVPLLRPIEKVVATVEKHLNGIVRRWTSLFSNARLECMNGLFQLARSRARGFRNPATFCLMICLIGAPIGDILCIYSTENAEEPLFPACQSVSLPMWLRGSTAPRV